ncbi:LYR motif-containing protein 5A isoform X1 [Silurus meridionalis]|nr:LYR motif-containing protein 5A isoform X1 [Silurus meridionalis]
MKIIRLSISVLNKEEKMSNPLRGEVIRLYKNLLFIGRDYPKGAVYFRERLKSAFMKNKDVTDPEKIRKLIDRGEFVIKELEALYFLRKYRAMKKRYYEPEH